MECTQREGVMCVRYDVGMEREHLTEQARSLWCRDEMYIA